MNGQDVKEKIRQTGKKFNEVAEEMHVTPQSLQKIFNSDDVRTGTLERIADAMGVPVTYFYDESTNGNINASSGAMVANRDVNNNSEKRSVLVSAEQLSTKDKQIDRLLGIIEKLSDDE